jgi:hypothetical protein
VVGSEVKIPISANRGRKPDLAVILPGSKAPPRTGPLLEPPDILIEVVTPTPCDERRDRVERMSEYARFGVPYFWLVDPTLGAVEIFERTPAGNYQKLVGVTAGSIDPVPGCPGLVVDVDALWAELAPARRRMSGDSEPAVVYRPGSGSRDTTVATKCETRRMGSAARTRASSWRVQIGAFRAGTTSEMRTKSGGSPVASGAWLC